ncbi:MAG: prefoldin subunit beta [archaeon]|nr:prefoldin subunit beta [archaeon]
MEFSPEITKKIQELQILEQNLQNFLMQKQNFQVEDNEILNALEELSKSGDEVYRILGGIMIKTDRNKLIKDLEEQKKIINLRIQSLEKQEKSIEEKSSVLQSEIQKSIGKK